MFDKLKPLGTAAKWFVGIVVSALVLVFFWHPMWAAVIAIAQKADKLFP